jgi:hypothetical protein
MHSDVSTFRLGTARSSGGVSTQASGIWAARIWAIDAAFIRGPVS